ncbi:MAG: HAD family phosphatase, partial [Calditrichales bacterium]
GVIVDSEPIHAESFRIFLRELGLPVDEAFISGLVGYSIDDNIETINHTYMDSQLLDITAGVNRRDEIYMELISRSELTPMPGIEELISVLSDAGWSFALASSSVRVQVDAILKNLSENSRRKINFSDLLRINVSGDEVKLKKPAPDLYARALSMLKKPAQECMAIEDSGAGIRSAKANELFCVALKNQYFKTEQLAEADLLVEHVDEITRFLSA